MPSVMDGVDRLTRIAGRNRLELLLFRLSNHQIFGINVFKVREVLKCPPLRSVPHSHAHVRGVMHARGQTITIIDLAAVLGHGESEGTPDRFVIVTEYSGKVQGYLVGHVERIVNLRWDEVKPPPAGIGNSNYLTAVSTIDGQLVEILDVEKVLAEIVGYRVDVTSGHAVGEQITLPHHVFIADDSSVARKQIMRVMDQIGITYDVAENGREAFERLQAAAADGAITSRYSMLISDIEMPEMDGYTLTKMLKADPALKDLYVCLHTSLSGNFNQSMAASVGADRLVPKFVPDDLAEMVISHVSGSHKASDVGVAAQ
ncbi:MAG: chemotaxis protein CheV [Gammaproteobacteria bacterium]|nr:chemotaxis protein CheV [Gammaproteobacteria bacterium]